MYKRLQYLTILLFSVLWASAQKNIEFNSKNFPDKEMLRSLLYTLDDGDYYFRNYAMDMALANYETVYKVNPDNAELNLKMGRCFMKTIEKEKSISYIQKAIKLDSLVAVDVKYYLAMAYQMNYDFDKALEIYRDFKLSLTPELLKNFTEKIEKHIEECNVGKKLVKNPARVFIENMGAQVNSANAEYGPIINADESILFFTSRRPNTTGGLQDEYNPGFYEDIYITYNINGVWTEPYNPGKPLNTEFHDAIVGISPDGQHLMLYRGSDGGGIYLAKLEGLTWSKPKLLPKPINTKNHEPSATLTSDMSTIYFVSDREGGYGGSDIYYSRRIDSVRWGEAINLGPVINTKYDEDAVFIHPDNMTLYFSSRGHSTMGGFDIFKSVLENGKWSEPENVGFPINTPDDDIFFSVSANGEHAYFASIRPGGYGNHDIYKINYFGPEKSIINNQQDYFLASVAEPVNEIVIEPEVELKTTQLTLLKGVIYDQITNQPISAKIDLVDNDKNEKLATFESNSATGKYLVSLPSGKNYGIAVDAEGYLFHSENFNIPKLNEFKIIELNVYLQKVAVGNEITLRNIFFGYNKSDLNPESVSELNRLAQFLIDNPTVKIEIAGHTDSIGTKEYNLDLSVKRAQSVATYLVNKGIDSKRLTAIGYGAEKPVAANIDEKGRQLNRRSEIKIIEK